MCVQYVRPPGKSPEKYRGSRPVHNKIVNCHFVVELNIIVVRNFDCVQLLWLRISGFSIYNSNSVYFLIVAIDHVDHANARSYRFTLLHGYRVSERVWTSDDRVTNGLHYFPRTIYLIQMFVLLGLTIITNTAVVIYGAAIPKHLNITDIMRTMNGVFSTFFCGWGLQIFFKNVSTTIDVYLLQSPPKKWLQKNK